jgi:hypothetical protein
VSRQFDVLALTVFLLAIFLLTAEVRSETVDVKYRGPVDLKPFECSDIIAVASFSASVTTKRKATWSLV